MEKLLMTRLEAARALSISEDTLDELRKAGKIKYMTIGSRVYIAADELRAFITKEGALSA
ncbi:MAG: helix-turn-helix domain-containing protein [Clostridia bacterium]|nr:helix-turn-helix domain-containing protein [Clostridia bacterium]